MFQEDNKLRKTGITVLNEELYLEENERNCFKAKAFDEISKMFYNRNFGSASKSEIELLMFSIYMDALIEKCSDEDNVLDYKKCSDYEIGKALGIPQERVKTLKVKKQARYPEIFDWKKSLLKVKNNVRYDDKKEKIVIPIRDPNLYNEIRNQIENSGGYIEIQRGMNCIQIRPEYYLMLFYETLEDEKEKKKCLKEVEKALQKINKDHSFKALETKQEMLNHLLSITENVLGIVEQILDKFDSPFSIIIKGIKHIGKIN